MFQVTKGMPEQPYHCIHCGGNPADFEGNQQQAIFSSGVDVNWGDSVYTCWDCANLIADLVDREPRESWERVNEENEGLKIRVEALTEALAEAEGDLEKIREGAAARSRVLAKSGSKTSDSE